MLIQWPNEREEAQLLSEHYRREGNKSYPQKSVNFICAVLSLSLPRDKQKCLCMYLIQWLHSLACVDTACIRKQKSLLCDFSITTTFQGAKCIRREYLQGSLVSIPPPPPFLPLIYYTFNQSVPLYNKTTTWILKMFYNRGRYMKTKCIC